MGAERVLTPCGDCKKPMEHLLSIGSCDDYSSRWFPIDRNSMSLTNPAPVSMSPDSVDSTALFADAAHECLSNAMLSASIQARWVGDNKER